MDFVMLVITALFAAYVLLGLIKRVNEWYYTRPLGDKKHHLPPGDMGWPLIGNLLSFLKAFRSSNPDAFINAMVNRYGRTGIYRAYMFGSPTIIVCAPETCRPALMDDEKFGLGYPETTMRLTGKRSFHSISNAEHKRLRKLITSPINGHKALSLYIGYIENAVIAALNEWTSTDKPIEFLCETRKIAFKVITRIFLGSSSESVTGSVEKYYHDLHFGLKATGVNLPGFAFHKALKARKMLIKILQGVIDERRITKRSDEEKGMIDLMMEVEDEEGKKLEDEDIIDLLIMFLLAGHESSALGTMWSVLFLYQHPEFLQNAKEEQENIMKRRPISQEGLTLKEIRQMEYLSKVIDEMLRRSNLSFSKFRRAKHDVNVNGYLIPKGWRVLVWSRAVHMDPETYSCPERFLPSRWDNQRPKRGSFIPFGAGSHICPGADLAKLEISIFLHYFILNYNFEQLNPRSPWVYLPVPRPKDNCLARIKKLPG